MHTYPEHYSLFSNEYNSNIKKTQSHQPKKLNYSPSILHSSNYNNSKSNSFFDYYGNIESMENPENDNTVDLGNNTNNGNEMAYSSPVDGEDTSEKTQPDDSVESEDIVESDDRVESDEPDFKVNPIMDGEQSNGLPNNNDLETPVPESSASCMFDGKKTNKGECYEIELGDKIPCSGLILPVNDSTLPEGASIQEAVDAADALGQKCKDDPKQVGCWYAKGTEITDKMVSAKLDSKARWCPGDYGFNTEDNISDDNKVFVQDDLDWQQFYKGCALSNNYKIDMATLDEKNKMLNQSIEEYNKYKEQALNEAKTSTINQDKAIIIKNSETGEMYWLNNNKNLKSLPKGVSMKDIEACNQGPGGYIQKMMTTEEINDLGPIDVASDNKEDICSANGVSVATTQAMVNAQQNIESTANQLQTHLNCMLKKDYHETAEIKQKKHVITQYLNRIRLEREVFQKNREILEKGRAQSAQDKIAYVSNYYWMIIWGLIILYIMYRIVK